MLELEKFYLKLRETREMDEDETIEKQMIKTAETNDKKKQGNEKATSNV
jgi:hypothetical protein